MPGKRVTSDIIQLVYYSFYEGKSVQDISKTFSLTRQTVYNIINRAEKENRLELHYSPGRPKKLSNRNERQIIKKVYNKPQISTRAIANEIKLESGVEISHETVRKVLLKNKYSSRAARKNHCFHK